MQLKLQKLLPQTTRKGNNQIGFGEITILVMGRWVLRWEEVECRKTSGEAVAVLPKKS